MSTINTSIPLSSSTKIGFFDSGIGGITILKKFLPLHLGECLYVADTAHMPYGNKTLLEIRQYSEHIVQFLQKQGAEIIIISCHTATALALPHLQKLFTTLPIVGVVDLVAKEAVKKSKNNRIGIVATQATIISTAHKQSVLAQNPHALVFEQACPELASAIENSMPNLEKLDSLVLKYLQPLLAANIDTLILGSTHYDVIKDIFEQVTKKSINLISAYELIIKKFTFDQINTANNTPLKMFVSGDINSFFKASKHLLSIPKKEISTIWL